MEYFADTFDVAVIGAGHAGIEAGLAAARLGCKTAVFTMNCLHRLYEALSGAARASFFKAGGDCLPDENGGNRGSTRYLEAKNAA